MGELRVTFVVPVAFIHTALDEINRFSRVRCGKFEASTRNAVLDTFIVYLTSATLFFNFSTLGLWEYTYL